MTILVKTKYEASILLPDSTDPLISLFRVSSNVTGAVLDSLTNDPPTAEQNSTMPIRITSTRKFGIIARHLVISRIVGTGSSSFRLYRKVPVLQPNVYLTVLSQVAPDISYEGFDDWTLVSGSEERYNLPYG